MVRSLKNLVMVGERSKAKVNCRVCDGMQTLSSA